MTTSRRKFIRNSALTLAGVALLSRNAFSSPFAATGELVGVQLYSVRDEMKKDPLGTLRQIAGIGYKNVEHANYVGRKFYGYTPAEFKKVLADLGLKMPSGHTVMSKTAWDDGKKDFSDDWKYTIEDAAVLGQEFVISPWLDESLRKTADDLKRYMEVFNKCGELCQKSGMRFGYHNHDFEFSVKFGDESVYDIILQNTDPKLVTQQLDIGNLYNGGVTALEIMKKYPGRFISMHVKDEIAVTGGHEKFESTVLGKGIVPVKEVIDLGRSSGGTKHFIVEQESYQGKTPVESCKADFDQMKKWGYK